MDPPHNLGWLMSHAGLKTMWKYHVVTAYRASHKNGELRFPARSAFLKQYPSFNGLLKKLYDLTWYAHIGACLLDPSASLRYIGRYTKRPVLAEYRITYYHGKKVRLAFKDYAEGGKTSFKTMSVLAFIGRLVRHIPEALQDGPLQRPVRHALEEPLPRAGTPRSGPARARRGRSP